MKISVKNGYGKATMSALFFIVALFTGIVTFILTDPAVSESQEIKTNSHAFAELPIKQVTAVKAMKSEISALRKQVYAEYRNKFGNGEALLARIQKYNHLVEAAASYYGLDSDLVTGLIAYESGGDNEAVSSVQAKGLMQIYIAPRLSQNKVKGFFRVKKLNLFNPAHNIFLGTSTLSHYIKSKNNDVLLGLVAYNGGLGATGKYKTFPSFYQNSKSGIKRFPLVVSAYALMSKVHKQTGKVIPYNQETKELFDSIALPGIN